MKRKKSDSLSFIILLIILSFISFYYYGESKNRMYKGDVVSKEATILNFKPTLNDYESTDDIEFEIFEYPDKVFKLKYTRIDFEEGKKILSGIGLNKKIVFDFEKQYFNKKIKQNRFLGIKPSIILLGIRQSELEEIPISEYNVEEISHNIFISIVSLIGVLIIVLSFLFKLLKTKIKKYYSQQRV